MLSINAAGYLVSCDFHAWGTEHDIFATGFLVSVLESYLVLDGFLENQGIGKSISGSLHRMPVWLYYFRIFE